MEQAPRKAAKLTGLIVTIIVIAALVVAVGSLCTCLCTCGTCLGCSDGEPIWSRQQSESDASAAPAQKPTEARESRTPSPLPTKAPAQRPSAAPTVYLITDEQLPAPTAQPTSELYVRPKQVQLRNDGTDTVTVLVLMNGSDLESEYGEATDDLTEMIRASKNERVKILVETVGTKKWDSRYGISSRRSQRYRVTDRGLTLVDDTLGQLDTTVPSTLSDFIRWGTKNYPADRYILLLWDHGGGPVYGFGYDEFQPYSSTLTIDEMQIALKDGGVYFDLIGMDCCLMSSLEVCCALYDYCDYMMLSEDFEPGCGWSHSEWLSALANDPAIATPALGKTAIDSSIVACENSRSEESMTLALIDESYVKVLFSSWREFALANEQTLLSQNYSQLRESTGRAHPCLRRAVGGWFDDDDYTLSDYCITDILSLAANIPSAQSELLKAAYDTAVLYYRATSNEKTLAGLSITLPYGDDELYGTLERVFGNAGFDADYIAWLGKFVEVESADHFFDFSDWNVWADYVAGHDWGDWVDTILDFGQLAGSFLDELDDSDYDDLFGWLFGGY